MINTITKVHCVFVPFFSISMSLLNFRLFCYWIGQMSNVHCNRFFFLLMSICCIGVPCRASLSLGKTPYKLYIYYYNIVLAVMWFFLTHIYLFFLVPSGLSVAGQTLTSIGWLLIAPRQGNWVVSGAPFSSTVFNIVSKCQCAAQD